MAEPVTGSMLRDLVVCERRVRRDLRGDPARREPVSEFVEILRDGGVLHGESVLAGLPGTVVELRAEPANARFEATVAALAGDADWIVGARLELGDRLGRPRLLAG